MKKKKLNKKGLTLCEVLVAMTIFAIMALLLATMVAATTRMNIKNYKMNKQMQAQGNSIEKEDVTAIQNSTSTVFEIKKSDGSTVATFDIEKHSTGKPGELSDYKYFN